VKGEGEMENEWVVSSGLKAMEELKKDEG